MKVSLILLAAGNSRRFCGNKLLYPIGGKAMYQHVTDEVLQLEDRLFAEKIVVSQYEEILGNLEQKGMKAVKNSHPEFGISHSIQLGIRASRKDADAWCFLVCDQPYLKAKTVSDFLQQWVESKCPIGCVGNKEKLGNPVIFSKVYRNDLLALTGDTGGKRIVKEHMRDVFVYQVKDAKELEDIDEKDAVI